jgi:hypothetical protein
LAGSKCGFGLGKSGAFGAYIEYEALSETGTGNAPAGTKKTFPTALALRRGRARYSDEKVANREIRVWHFVIENGY